MEESDCLLAKFLFQIDFLTLQRRIKDELHLVSALVAPAAPLKRNLLEFSPIGGNLAWLLIRLLKYLFFFCFFLSVTAIKSCYSIIIIKKSISE